MAKKEQEAAEGKPANLDVEQDMPFIRKEWAAERIAWVVFLLLFLAALAGLLGTGPLSHTTASSGAMEVEYYRFVHRNTGTELIITPGEATGDTVDVDSARSCSRTSISRASSPNPISSTCRVMSWSTASMLRRAAPRRLPST
jgi:hypothetical protein